MTMMAQYFPVGLKTTFNQSLNFPLTGFFPRIFHGSSVVDYLNSDKHDRLVFHIDQYKLSDQSCLGGRGVSCVFSVSIESQFDYGAGLSMHGLCKFHWDVDFYILSW